MGLEGEAAARWLNARGVTAFVLEYRLSPAYRYPAQILDGARAIRLVRAQAQQLGVDPHKLGAWGFSAGGHLAGYLAARHDPGDPAAPDPIERASDRPDFVILSYARLDTDPAFSPKIPFGSILPEPPSQADIDRIDVVRFVDPDTSPAILYSTTADETVNSLNSTSFYNALKRAGVPAELHIFERGPHGTGMGQNLKPDLSELAIFPTLLEHWMKQNAWMP